MTRIPTPKRRAAAASDIAAARLPEKTTSSLRPGALHIVATPIGNPDDITLRALETLRTVVLILAEDARITRALLQRHAIETPVLSLRPRYAQAAQSALLQTLQNGQDVALVCDAGTPALADPGAVFVRSALEIGASIVASPGPFAALAALVVSGLSTVRFVFEGFPPRARADRDAFFRQLATEPRTILLYESPSMLCATLTALLRVLGSQHPVALCCDLTKRTEFVFRGTLAEASAAFVSQPSHGEYVLVLAGFSKTSGA